PDDLVDRLGAGLGGDRELLVARGGSAARATARRNEDDEHADEGERRPPPLRLDHVLTPPSTGRFWKPANGWHSLRRLTGCQTIRRRSSSSMTLATGSAGVRCPRWPVISSLTKRALSTASSVACTVAS